MKKSISMFVVCVAFFVLVNQSTAKVPTSLEVLSDSDYAPLSDNARNLVATMLDHAQQMLRNENASSALITLATNTEKVLTSQNGQDNIMAILDLLGFFLKDPNASKIITIWCDKADILITTVEGRRFLRSTILSFHRVLSTDNVVPAAEAMMAGIETYLKKLTPEQLIKGIKFVQNNILKSNVSVNESELQARDIPADFSYSQTFEPLSKM